MKAQKKNSLELRPIGVIRSKIKERSKAPKQGSEGARMPGLNCIRSPHKRSMV
jgi:tRNA (Thr-GGU) A37 N-methylase